MQWELVGSVAASLTMFGFVPQIMKIYRTKSVEDVSSIMLLQFSAGIFLWMLYGIHIQNNILIVSNAVSFVTLIVTAAFYLRYRNKKIK